MKLVNFVYVASLREAMQLALRSLSLAEQCFLRFLRFREAAAKKRLLRRSRGADEAEANAKLLIGGSFASLHRGSVLPPTTWAAARPKKSEALARPKKSKQKK
jgi:hypothetical protein